MALTRKMLQAMDIPEDKIGQIIVAHTETVDAINEELDKSKAEIKTLSAVKKELEKANAQVEKITGELEKLKSEDWEGKYNTVKGEYDTFKTDIETKATKAAKESAYKQLLLDAGISEKRITSILKVSDVDSVELDKDGKIKDSEKLSESVKNEWADFISTTHKEGAKTTNPPDNTGGDVNQPSRAAMMAAKYRNEHYGNPEKED